MHCEFLGNPNTNFDDFGSKAKNLNELKKIDLPVPEGFGLIVDDYSILDQNKSILEKKIKEIGGYPIAVRSSSQLEDLTGASFAGLYESYLNVSSWEDFLIKINLILASARSERVKSYFHLKNIEAKQFHMRILVQKMILPELSGVYFTINPRLGKEEEGYAETCLGLGEQLVSGKISPSQFHLDIEHQKINKQVITEQGGVLSPEKAKELIQESLKISAHFGCPQDIEFAIDSMQKLWILQARPITNIEWRKDVAEFTNADFKDGGISASVCSPMMYSLYENAMQKSMQEYFKAIKLLKKNEPQRNWIKSFYGRAYWNASEVKSLLFKIPGFSEKDFDLDLGIQKDYGSKGPHTTPLNLKTLWSILPTAFALEREYQHQLNRTENYLEKFYLKQETMLIEQKKTLPLELWIKDVFIFQHQVEFDYFRTIYNNANLQSDFKKFLQKIENKIKRKIDLTILYSGVEGISHLNAQKDFRNLVLIAAKEGIESSLFEQNFNNYLSLHGFHADRELDLLCPRYLEIPEIIKQRIFNLSKNPNSLLDPTTQVEQQHAKYQNEIKVIQNVLNKNSWIKVKKYLDKSRLYLRRREEMRECSSRAYALVRWSLIDLAKEWTNKNIIKLKEDIFYLRFDELLNKKFEMQQKINFRKLFLSGFEKYVPPNELGFGIQNVQSVDWENDHGNKILKGLGCSPGLVEGRVRVITNLEDAYLLEKGEILVTRFTDPGWTTILSLTEGVITEVGGLLSHAAVIGRELGVPAILNLPNATTLLKSGDHISMNGNTGVIRLLAKK